MRLYHLKKISKVAGPLVYYSGSNETSLTPQFKLLKYKPLKHFENVKEICMVVCTQRRTGPFLKKKTTLLLLSKRSDQNSNSVIPYADSTWPKSSGSDPHYCLCYTPPFDADLIPLCINFTRGLMFIDVVGSGTFMIHPTIRTRNCGFASLAHS